MTWLSGAFNSQNLLNIIVCCLNYITYNIQSPTLLHLILYASVFFRLFGQCAGRSRIWPNRNITAGFHITTAISWSVSNSKRWVFRQTCSSGTPDEKHHVQLNCLHYPVNCVNKNCIKYYIFIYHIVICTVACILWVVFLNQFI